MNVLINLGTIKAGGGQNVALNFLHGLFEINDDKNIYLFLIVKGSANYHFIKNKNINYKYLLITSHNPIKRLYQEYFKYPSIFKNLKIDIIYTYFGFGLFRSKIPQVCGVAVSNVFFPEIKFWHGSLKNVIIRKIIDQYRIYGIKKASALIFENKTMEEKSHLLFKISPSKTIFIPPSFNPNYEHKSLDIPELKRESTKILLLCGWQLNKNIMKVPEIAYHLKNNKHSYKFIITAPKDNSKMHKVFMHLIKQYKVEEMIDVIGTVKKQYLKSLYKQINFSLLMSKLESFSNNIIESWYFNKPIIVSDEKWARDICKNAAIYVNRESPQKVAESIKALYLKPALQNELIKEGFKQLQKYPTFIEKTKKELLFIEKIYNDYQRNI